MNAQNAIHIFQTLARYTWRAAVLYGAGFLCVHFGGGWNCLYFALAVPFFFA